MTENLTMGPKDRSRCVVLVPTARYIEPECERSLRELETRGYVVRRVPGFSAIDLARCVLATEALQEGFEELMWIDADVGFDADAVDRLRTHHCPFVCGVYAKRGRRELACSFLPGTKAVEFGSQAPLIEIQYCGFGFVLTHRTVFETIADRLELPICNKSFGKPLVPYFHPLISRQGEEHWYLGEDYSFCERARQCGIPLIADLSIRLWHVGHYGYSWEDAGSDKERYAQYSYRI